MSKKKGAKVAKKGSSKATSAVSKPKIDFGAHELTGKSAGAFRELVGLYESKQFKKGLKAADALLKDFPGHGETLSMKGLCTYNLGKKEEGMAMMKDGLTKNIKSYICWHVLGVVHKARSEYEQAMKCYQNALKHDEKNLTILRDLAYLQIYLRDYAGFARTENTLLVNRAENKVHWMGFAVGSHLAGNGDKALEVIDAYLKSQEKVSKDEKRIAMVNMEESELHLYKVMIMTDLQKHERALAYLRLKKSKITDDIRYFEVEASLLSVLKKGEEAAASFEHLIGMNPDNLDYYWGYLEGVLGKRACLTVEERERALAILESFEDKYRSKSLRRLCLDFAVSSAFQERVDAYAKEYLRKGIPSLFSDLKGLYGPGESESYSTDKIEMIEELFCAYAANLKKCSRFTEEASGVEEPRCALLWTLFYLSQHWHTTGEYEKALSAIDEAIAHTPTLPDLYMVKASILKGVGAFSAAAESSEFGRKLDLADRYLNCESTKFLHFAGKMDQARDVAYLFNKEKYNSFYSLQVAWFELSAACGYFQTGEIGKAMKMNRCVIEHFSEFREDEFEFNQYCLRRGLIRDYVRNLRYLNTLPSSSTLLEAVSGMLECYLVLDERRLKDDIETKRISDDEKAALKRRRQKAEKRLKEEETKEIAAEKARHQAKETEVDSLEYEDYHGLAMAGTKTPVLDAVATAMKVAEAQHPSTKALVAATEIAIRNETPDIVVKLLEKMQSSTLAQAPIFASFCARAKKLSKDGAIVFSEFVDAAAATFRPSNAAGRLSSIVSVLPFVRSVFFLSSEALEEAIPAIKEVVAKDGFFDVQSGSPLAVAQSLIALRRFVEYVSAAIPTSSLPSLVDLVEECAHKQWPRLELYKNVPE